ncbi:MAG: hypothetical protein J5J00_15935 [Deltaproteobacteria bacterium]|nr:hypothetical protein [Deltaproteobacteria bacterium]
MSEKIALRRSESAVSLLYSLSSRFFTFAVAFYLFSRFTFSRIHFNWGSPYTFASLEQYLASASSAPYCYRVLPAYLMKAIDTMFGRAVAASLNSIPELQIFAAHFRVTSEHAWLIVPLFTLFFLCFYLFCLVFRFMLSHFCARRAIVCGGLLFLSAALPIFFQQGTHFIYDPFTLLLSAGMLLAVLKGSWGWYYATFFLACINKELALVAAVPFFAVRHEQDGSYVLRRHLLIHAGIFGAVRLLIYFFFNFCNGGGALLPALPGLLTDNLIRAFGSPLLTDFAYFTAALGVVYLVCRKLADKPASLRYVPSMMVLLGLLLMWGGIWGEIRVFYEALPAALILVYWNFIELLNIKFDDSTRDPAGTLFRLSCSIVTIIVGAALIYGACIHAAYSLDYAIVTEGTLLSGSAMHNG